MKYTITVEITKEGQELEKYPTKEKVYEQSTNKEIDLVSIINAFNKEK